MKKTTQGGDITKGDGTGGESIYGQNFKDESFTIKHDRAGLLSMANSGPDTNGSQFFVTLDECRHLDGKHVCFGRVTSGFHIFQNIAKVPTGLNDRPKKACTIVNCGQVMVMTEEVRLDSMLEEVRLATKRLRRCVVHRNSSKNEKNRLPPLLLPLPQQKEQAFSRRLRLMHYIILRKTNNARFYFVEAELRSSTLENVINVGEAFELRSNSDRCLLVFSLQRRPNVLVTLLLRLL